MNKDKLIAWYEFLDKENIGKDSSGNNMTATACGTNLPTIHRVGGRMAVELQGGVSGSSFLELPKNLMDSVSDETGLTVSTWVYCESTMSPWERVFDLGKGETGPYIFLTKLMRAVCFKNEDIAADAGHGLAEGQWVHLAFVMAGTHNGTASSAGPRLYINGELCADGMISQTSSGNYKAYREFLACFEDGAFVHNYIGHSQYGADPDFHGAFSDFRIYNACLEEADIVELLCASLEPLEILELARDKYLQAPLKIITSDISLSTSLMGGKVSVNWSMHPSRLMTGDGQLAPVTQPEVLRIKAKLSYEKEYVEKEFESTVMPKGMPSYEIIVDGSKKVLDVSDTLYGLFYEDINHAADGGIYAEMIQNRSFENFTFANYDPSSGICGKTAGRLYDPLKYWFGDTKNLTFCQKDEASYSNYVQVKGGSVLYNHGFCDEAMGYAMNLKAGESYAFSIWMKSMKGSCLSVCLCDPEGNSISNEIKLNCDSTNEWKKYEADLLVANKTCLGQIRLSFSEDVAIDLVSMFPQKVWGVNEEETSASAHKNYLGNPNYRLRRDLVEAMRDLHPTFLRFPGGCISEGSYIWDNVYDWKDSVGPVETRLENFNVWGYNMTLGLGYMEYFQLSEDLGATPLPVMACGVLCQARSDYAAPAGGELREKYIRNFTDLIDFAISTDMNNEWARLRRDMGHEAPFDLHYLGVGNENWGTEFYANFEVFYQRIQEHMEANYPGYELHIISTAGAQADDTSYQLGWQYLTGRWPQDEVVPFTDGEKDWEETVKFYQYKKDYLNTIVDEHYYRSNDYLLANVDRYNYYYRGAEISKVFVGEYASSDKNTLAGAVAEAAVMTGFENNSDVVRLAATAPLFNKVGTDGTYRWTPDVIWFDDETVWKTPNYYVQQLFAQYIGSRLLGTQMQAYEKGRKVVREPHGGVTVRKSGEVEFQKLIVTNQNGEVVFLQEFGHKVPEEMVALADGYYICHPEWKNYKVELLCEVLSDNSFVSVGAGVYGDSDEYDEQQFNAHEYVVGHPQNGTGLRVCKEGEEGYKMGDYSSSVYAGNLRHCYMDPLKRGTYKITVDFGCEKKDQIHCEYEKVGGKATGALGVLDCNLTAYNKEIFTSVTEDDSHVYMKLVNADSFEKKCAIGFQAMTLEEEGKLITLTGDSSVRSLPNVNRRGAEVIVPVEKKVEASNYMVVDLPGDSVSVLVLTKK